MIIDQRISCHDFLPIRVILGRCDKKTVFVIYVIARSVFLVIEKILHRIKQMRHCGTAVIICPFLHFHKLVCIEKVKLACQHADSDFRIICDRSLAGLSGFGCDENHTVGTFSAIHGGCCSILKHINALDIGSVDKSRIHIDNTIHYINRVASGIDGSHTADSQ